MVVYKITNKVNGKVYIGQTKRPLIVRWKQHCIPSNDKCVALHRAIQKYGKENFTVEQIDVASDRDELNKKEIYWIQHYDCLAPKGYNLRVGGGQGEIVSEETRYRLGNGNRGKHLSDETKKKMSEARRGFKMSPESIAKSVETKRANGTYKRLTKVAKKNGKSCSKRVRCVETGKVYSSITKAAEKNNLFRGNISACLRGLTKTAGKLHWKYV